MPIKDKIGLKIDLDSKKETVTIMVINRDTDEILMEEVFSQKEITKPDIQTQISLYGLSKLLQDRTSGIGKGENKAEKLPAMKEVFARLQAGEWEAERKSGSGGVVSIKVQALAAVFKVDIPTIQLSLKKYDEEQRLALFAKPPVVAMIKKLEKAEPVEDIDLDSL